MAVAILPVAGLCLEGLGLLLHIIGLATPEWSAVGQHSQGLWESCGLGSCGAYPYKPSALEAAEAFAILGMLLAAAAVLAAFLFVLLPILGREVNVPFHLVSMGAAIPAFVCIVICVICWAAEVVFSGNFGYSFGLSIAGGILLLLGGIIVFVGGKESPA